ncbi:VOC family protein [Paenibacillus sp. FJAT-26967]|uniref:VOC family protein n=1 Tax=Paenibacillus sp. FJAT-26967 TaxID=1729690 RepID=UPI000837B9FB|nr:VOC family protein [Paenibacillus sp. FJAT-26967]
MAKFFNYIFSENATVQAEFYTQALGGEILSVMTHGQLPGAKEELKDKVLNLSFVAAGVNFLICDSIGEPVVQGNAINLCLEYGTESEAHEAFDKLSEGGNVQHPLQPAFWGSLFGQVEDKFGVKWMVTTEAVENSQ